MTRIKTEIAVEKSVVLNRFLLPSIALESVPCLLWPRVQDHVSPIGGITNESLNILKYENMSKSMFIHLASLLSQ